LRPVEREVKSKGWVPGKKNGGLPKSSGGSPHRRVKRKKENPCRVGSKNFRSAGDSFTVRLKSEGTMEKKSPEGKKKKSGEASWG